jgi:predicted GNAT family acetyltransferase
MKQLTADQFFDLLNERPELENYHDSLKLQDKNYLDAYRFFSSSKNDIFSKSPDGNLHLYSRDPAAIEHFLSNIKNDKFNLVFSYADNDPVIRRIIEVPIQSRPFFYLKKEPRKTTPSTHLTIRMAHAEDQDLINHWYNSFNAEENSSWPVPNIITAPETKLILCFYQNRFIGGAANTLTSKPRLWVGRLWIEALSRRNGAAKGIMNFIEALALTEGKDLSLLVSENNSKALELYSRLDYKTIGHNCFWFKL